jgi:hypothetical protein
MPRAFMRCQAARFDAPMVADLADADQIVQRAQRLLPRRERVVAVDLVEVDVIGAEALQAGVDGVHDVAARQPDRVGAAAGAPAGLGRHHHILAPRAQRLAQDLLRAARRVDVGAVEEVDPRVQADAHQPIGLRLVGAADGLEHSLAAEGHGPEAELGDPQPGAAQPSIVHVATSFSRK